MEGWAMLPLGKSVIVFISINHCAKYFRMMLRSFRLSLVLGWLLIVGCLVAGHGGLARAAGQEAKITFYGGAQEIGGSCQMLQAGKSRILIDYGAMVPEEGETEGLKAGEGKTGPDAPFEVGSIDAVLISHAHLDHLGRLPLLYRLGYRKPIHMTRVTKELASTLLEMVCSFCDFGIEEFYASTKSNTAHSRIDCDFGKAIKAGNVVRFRATRPELAQLGKHMCSECVRLEVAGVMQLIKGHEYGEWFQVTPEIKASFLDAGHIPGSAIIVSEMSTAGGPFRVAYACDYGSGQHPFLNAPSVIDWAQVLIMESTYGCKRWDFPSDPYGEFYQALADALTKGNRVIIPCYVMDRTQKVLGVIGEGMRSGRVPKVPILEFSPTAEKITGLYRMFHDDRSTYLGFFATGFLDHPFLENLQYIHTHLGRVDALPQPGIFITSSADGKYGSSHELINALAGNEKTTFITVGWAPPSSPVGQLQKLADEGKTNGEIKVDGKSIQVRAQVKKSGVFTGHADQKKLTELVSKCDRLQKVFLVHGEPEGISCLAESLGKVIDTKIKVEKPKIGQSFDLVAG
jgi:metallo-beta-lactamase family protein